MKRNRILIILIMLTSLIFMGCFNKNEEYEEYEEYGLIIEADQYIINCGGLDKAKFTPRLYNTSNEEIEIKEKINYFVDGYLVDSNTFSSEELGEFIITAQVGRIKSTRIKICVVPKYRIKIEADKNFIFDNSGESIEFSAKILDKNNEEVSTEKLEYFIEDYWNEDIKLNNNIFSSDKADYYDIYAKLEGSTSNQIGIKIKKYFRIELKADKYEVVADSKDGINFDAKAFYIDNIEKKNCDINYYVNDLKLEDSIYKTNKVGEYTAYAIVDDLKSEEIVFNVREIPLEVNLVTNKVSYVGCEVQLDGSKSKNGGGEEINYSWKIISKPEGSKVELDNAKIEKPTLKLEEIGEYVISLTVDNGIKVSESKEIRIKSKAFNDFSSELDLTEIEKGNFEGYNFSKIETLTDGWIIFGDTDKNKIIIANVITGEIGKEIQLNATPINIKMDYDNGILWCGQKSANRMAKISIEDGVVEYIETVDKIGEIVIGNDGYIFGESKESLVGEINIIDSKTNSVVKKCKINEEGLKKMIYIKDTDNLIVLSNNELNQLSRYLFDKETLEFKLIEIPNAQIKEIENLLISPDEKHMAILGKTNDSKEYLVFDLSSDDFSTSYGGWNTGYQNIVADFSNDNKMIIVSYEEKMLIFEVETHGKVKDICNSDYYSQYEEVFFSKENKLVYGIDRNGLKFYNITMDY